MPTPLDKLIGLSLVEIGTAMRSPRWEREMERIIRTAHTAAYITATAERLGISDPALISRARLTRAEKADIERAVARQLQYLRGFVAAREGMSDAAALARARMYGSAVRPFYYQQRWGEWEIPDRLLPGMQQCLSNCRCRLLDVKDNGDGTGVLTRVMEGTENHCTECPGLAGDHPVKRRAAVKVWRWAWGGWAIKHGAHDQSSHGRRTARRRASQAAYRSARAEGYSPEEARSVAREAGLAAQGARNQRLARMQLRGATPAPLKSDSAALPVQRFSDPKAADAAMRRQGLIKGTDMSQDENRTLQWYQSNGHDRINAELRGTSPVRDQWTLDNATGNLDTIMQRSRLRSNVEVQRGMLLNTPEAIARLEQWQPGATFRDPGYLSTTFSPSVARAFGAGRVPANERVRTVDVRIRVPAGTPGVYMPTARPLSGVANEYELLLGRGLNYRVVSRVDTPDGRSTVELEIVP